jgi:hypothetical protein
MPHCRVRVRPDVEFDRLHRPWLRLSTRVLVDAPVEIESKLPEVDLGELKKLMMSKLIQEVDTLVDVFKLGADVDIEPLLDEIVVEARQFKISIPARTTPALESICRLRDFLMSYRRRLDKTLLLVVAFELMKRDMFVRPEVARSHVVNSKVHAELEFTVYRPYSDQHLVNEYRKLIEELAEAVREELKFRIGVRVTSIGPLDLEVSSGSAVVRISLFKPDTKTASVLLRLLEIKSRITDKARDEAEDLAFKLIDELRAIIRSALAGIEVETVVTRPT